VEELTRIPSDVQDALITILSEKTLPVPELGTEVQAVQGFSVIATANDRDRGVNDLSSALRRRFNTVVLPLPATEDEEVDIVARRVAQLGRALELPEVPSALEEIRRVVMIFRELRSGITADQRTRLKSPTGTMSPAEAISVITSGIALAAHFGDGVLRPADVAAGIVGAVIKDPITDGAVWSEYLEAVVRERRGWDDFYRACREVGG
jgi:MoxR-like ATPase